MREGDEVGGAGARGVVRTVGAEPALQGMAGVLGLPDRVDVVLLRRAALVPGAVAAGDVAALGLDDGEADAGPRDEEVDLVLRGVVQDREVGEEGGVVGKGVAQGLPDGALGGGAGRVGGGEVRVGWVQVRGHAGQRGL